MKIIKPLLILFFTITIDTSISAYEFDFINTTDFIILLKMETRKVSQENYYALIPPRQSVKFALPDAYCFLKASWSEWESNKTNFYGHKVPYNSGMDLVTKNTGPLYVTKKVDGKIVKEIIENTIAIGRIEGQIKSENKQTVMGRDVAPAYKWERMETIMVPNEVFTATVKAASQMLKGADQFACQIIDNAKSLLGITTIENAIRKGPAKNQNPCFFGLGDIANAAGKLAGGTFCTHKQFEIIYSVIKSGPNKGDIEIDQRGLPILRLITNEGQ